MNHFRVAEGCTTRGFTLLEVMVALVLVTAMGLAIFNWINSSLMSLARVEEHVAGQRATRDALAFMKTVNPMEKPAGEAQAGPYLISWQASEFTEPVQGVGHPAGTSLYRLALYDTHVWVETNDERLADFYLRQVGYRQTREFQFGF